MVSKTHDKWIEGKGRYGFLDLYRGIIVIFMLEGHVLRELLTPELRSTQFFTIHEIFHGITAPGFLFGAGFAFAIATLRRWEQATTLNYSFFRRSWRAIILIFMGYVLHVPFLSIQKTSSLATPEKWNELFLFDVLQCIGFSLLAMRLLLVIVNKEKLFIASLIFFLFGIVYSTPFFWNEQFSASLHPALASALNGLKGSPFPLFPYAGFLLAGTGVSWLFLRAVQSEKEHIFIKRLLLIGIFFIIAGYTLDSLPFKTYSDYSFWYTSPNYFWIRLGFLFILLSILWYIEDFIASHRNSALWTPKWLTILGVESLFVYIVHLLILYGWVTNTNVNLRQFASNQLDYTLSTIIFIAMTLFLIYASFAWRYLKKNHPILMKGIFTWMGFYLIWSLLFSLY